MSEDNQLVGAALFASGNDEARFWFKAQWQIWPKRADERYTTNISLLYGGVEAYRAEYGQDPEMSDDFRSHVEWHDRQEPTR